MPLPDDSLEKWMYKEHTKVKHEILSKYLGGWIKILGKFHNLNIFDCFAGRGRFSEGEEGSPLVIIKTLASPIGCELMKEIMYKTGTEGRFGYLGPAEGQMNLTRYDGLSKLKEFLLNRFRGRRLSYRDLRYETLMDTDFVKKHYRKALLELEEEGNISISGKGPRGGLQDDSQIAFP